MGRVVSAAGERMGTVNRFPAPTHDSLKAKAARLLAPGYSYCRRCGMPWNRVKGHDTPYLKGRACFPLCEGCWETLGHPEARIEYYAALLDAWDQDRPVEPEVRAAIGRAVANGG
jgi:hypothetical protein